MPLSRILLFGSVESLEHFHSIQFVVPDPAVSDLLSAFLGIEVPSSVRSNNREWKRPCCRSNRQRDRVGRVMRKSVRLLVMLYEASTSIRVRYRISGREKV